MILATNSHPFRGYVKAQTPPCLNIMPKLADSRYLTITSAMAKVATLPCTLFLEKRGEHYLNDGQNVLLPIRLTGNRNTQSLIYGSNLAISDPTGTYHVVRYNVLNGRCRLIRERYGNVVDRYDQLE